MTFLIRNIIYKYSTIVLLVVLCICSIFVVHNNFTLKNSHIAKNIQELTDRRTGESPVNTSKCEFCRLLCTHLSGNCSKIKTIEMHNNLQIIPSSGVQHLLLAGTEKQETLTAQVIHRPLWDLLSFTERYFELLPTSSSTNNAFIKVSVEYFNLYQTFKFSSYSNFKKHLA